jgi:hypothetical protein
MLRLTRHSGLALAAAVVLGMGLAPTVYAGTGTEKQAALQATPPPAKPVAPVEAKQAKKPATAAAREAEKSAIDVVRRIQTVMVQEQAKPDSQATPAHVPDAASSKRKAPRAKPAPLLRWVGVPLAGDITLTWDAGLQPGVAAGLGVRLVWPAELPGDPQK